jgi:Protein of unknown function (DUF3592)
MDKPAQIKLVAIIAILAGPFLAVQGYNTKQSLAALEKEGVTVEGVIDGGESSSGRRRSSSYSFDVSFAPQTGAPQKKAFKVTGTFFKAHVTGEAISDPKVQVRYLPTNVDTSILVGGSTDNSWTFPVGIAACIGGLLTALYMFFMYKPAVA